MRKAKEHKLKRKRYSCLTEVRNEIANAKVEKVKEFNGYELTTNKKKYTMYDSVVYVNGEPHGTD